MTVSPHGLQGLVRRDSVLVRGLSHFDLALQSGALPPGTTLDYYVQWARGPAGAPDPATVAAVNAAAASALASKGFCDADVTAAVAQVTLATTQADNASTSAATATTQAGLAAASAAAAAASASSFNKASAAEISAGADDAKFTTSKGLADSMAFVANTAGELAAGVLTLDMSKGVNRSHLLAANVTVAKPTNMKDGVVYCIRFTEDGTGGRTVTLNAFFDVGGGTAIAINTGANKVSKITFQYDAARDKGDTSLAWKSA